MFYIVCYESLFFFLNLITKCLFLILHKSKKQIKQLTYKLTKQTFINRQAIKNEWDKFLYTKKIKSKYK